MAKTQSAKGKAKATGRKLVLNAEEELGKLEAAKRPMVVTQEDLVRRHEQKTRIPPFTDDEAFEWGFSNLSRTAPQTYRKQLKDAAAVTHMDEKRSLGGQKSAAAKKEKVKARNKRIVKRACELLEDGVEPRQIVSELAAEGFQSEQGDNIGKKQIRNILKGHLPERFGSKEGK